MEIRVPFGAALLLLTPQLALSYEHPLDDHTIREAYFLGQDRDKVSAFLAKYAKQLPLPKTGPHVAEIQVRTPYEQVVERSAREGSTSFSVQQAQQDFAQAGEIFVRVRINLTPSYPAFVGGGTGKQPVPRPDDFWRDFRVRVIQDDTVSPSRTDGRSLYQSGLRGPRVFGDTMLGAEIELTFGTSQIATRSLRVEVLTPDGETVEAEFDLERLK